MQSPDFRSVDDRGCRPPQPLPILPCMSQASPSSFPQYFPFEFGKNSKQSSHRSTGRRGQIQRLGQRDKPDAEMLQLLECRQQIRYRPTPAVQPPNQHYTDLATAGCLQQFLTSFPLGRTGADLTDVYGNVITELAESGAGDEVIMSIAGHVSRAMLSRYSHVRMEAKRRALDEIAALQLIAEEKRREEITRQTQTATDAEVPVLQ